MKLLHFLTIVFFISLGGIFAVVNAQDKNKDKTATFKGEVFRSDTKVPFAGARVVLTDEKKSAKRDNSQTTQTDKEGNFSFARVVEGKYTLTVTAEFEKETDVPCKVSLPKLATGSTPLKDKLSISVRPENKKFVEQLQIKNFAVKANDNILKVLDLVCEGAPKNESK